jgi:hypothetical protein
LYNLINDVGEKQNVAGENQVILKKLVEKLETVRAAKSGI